MFGCDIMPRKAPVEQKEWILDKKPVTVKFYDTVITVEDEKNIIYIDKREKSFMLELHGKFTFGKTIRSGKKQRKKTKRVKKK